MTNPVQSVRGVKLVLKVGNGAGTEVFTTLCTVNAQRAIAFDAETNETEIIDCDDPDAIAWKSLEKKSLQMTFTGGGMFDRRNTKRLWDWWRSEDPKNCKVILDDDDPDNVITWSGAFQLTNFDLQGDRGAKAQANMTLKSDGAITAVFGDNVTADV